MTTQDVKKLVESFGLPYAYRQFDRDTAASPPFLCFFYGSSDDFMADNCNYQPIRGLSIELYTDQKDFALENAIEARLKELGIPYYKESTYIKEQRLYMTTYETDIYLTEEG